MARSKSHRDDEDLRGMLRQAKVEIKALKRRLRQLEKNKHIWEQYNLDSIDREEIEETKPTKCPECGDGTLIYVDLGIKHLMSCSNCKYRTKAIDK
jgi:ribosomal protein S27AE